MKRLVFIHGRAQENKDAKALKGEWVSAWSDGLAKSNLKLPVADDQIRFPYYGQTLYDLVAGKPPSESAQVIIRGTDVGQAERDFVSDFLSAACDKAQIKDEQLSDALGSPDVIQRGPLNWEWVQALASVLDRHVPFGSGASVALFTHDVYMYLRNPGIRDEIESGILAAMEPGVPTIVVSHSLGTVVAYNLLRREGQANNWVVPLFVTVGSPLAVNVIKTALAPIKMPACVQTWRNAMDERDIVALYPLDKQNFPIDPEVFNKTDVRNHTSNRHGIAGYLDDPVVAKWIHDSLTT